MSQEKLASEADIDRLMTGEAADLVFTDPYRVRPGNRWTSPQLDDEAAAFWADAPLKAEVQQLKLKRALSVK